MKLTKKLALSQIKTNRNRSIMTLFGIILSSAMLTAVCGYVESARATIYNALGYDPNAGYHTVLIVMGIVLGSIIITASVVVVSNAFRVSASERTKQFGILKSVGATKKQIATSVLYEGIFLSIIGIPVGIAVGLLIEFLGTYIITSLLNSMFNSGTLNVDSEAMLNIPFATPPLMFVVATVTSLGTVLLSAWLPARKAARIPAIDAIRSTGEVKLKKKSIQTSKLTFMLFGFEGTLAAKSLKRSRRSFRATVISLTISIVLLIVSGSLGALMKSSTNLMFPNIDATAVADWSSNKEMTFSKTEKDKITNINYIPLDNITAENITKRFRAYDDTEIYGIGGMRKYTTKLPNSEKVTSALIYVDKVHYDMICEIANVSTGSNILINLRRKVINGKRTEYIPYNFAELKGVPLTFNLAGHEPKEVTIDGVITGQDISNEIIKFMSSLELAVIVPSCESSEYTWYAKTNDVTGFTKYANQILNDLAPQSKDGIYVYTESIDISSITKQVSNLYNTVMLFVYGFVGMLTLIAVTSVISTISTNIRSRRREFAILESVGMTKSGIKKMLNLESILCSTRSLVLGIPLGIIGSYALYYGMAFSIELPFSFPWLSIMECVFGVFVVTWVTMRYSASRLKDGDIVEIIRSE